MSGRYVLNAIASYLQSGVGTIPHLAQVYENPPKFVSKGAFYEGPIPDNASTGAIIWLWLGPQSAKRMNLMGTKAGGKMYSYDLHLQCVLLCTAAKAENADQDNRDFIDGLTSYIDADKNAGTAKPDGTSLVFSWGEGKFPGQDDMQFEPGWPTLLNDGTTHVYTKGTVTVQEYHGAGV